MAFELRTMSMTVTGALLLLLVAGGSGCGDFVESGDDVKRLTVGPEGGTLTIGEFALVVPPHSLDHAVTLSAHRAAMDAPAGPAFIVDSTDHTTLGSMPADVTIHYDAAIHTHAVDVYVGIFMSGVWHQLTRPATDPGTAGLAHGVTTTVGSFGVIECPAGVCP
jgi:hypothetical protein